MKVISKIGLLLAIALLAIACEIEERETFAPQNLDFVRFSLQVDRDSQLIRDVATTPSSREVDRYEHQSLDTIYLPVAWSTASGTAELEVSYEVVSSAPELADDLYTVVPAEQRLRFTAGEPVQYISVVFNRAWEAGESVELTFRLTESSDPDVTLGYPRQDDPMREVTVTFGGSNILNTYELSQEIYSWPENDPAIVEVRVDFAIPALEREIGSTPELLELVPAGVGNSVPDLAYTIEAEPLTGATGSITYRITILTPPDPDAAIFYRIRLREGLHPRYLPGRRSEAALIREPELSRIDFDAAGLFVNPSDPLNRLFGFAWYYNEADELCKWQRFATFTQAVAVDEGDPNNNGNGVHKYIVAHRGSNVGTNPFNNRRYYSGASVSSPAYWLEEALEFFPETPDRGKVRVVTRNLEFFRRSDDRSVFIPMAGMGDYFFNVELNAYQIDLAINYDESTIGGPSSVTHYVKLYSRDLEVDLGNLNEPCVPYVEL